MQGVRKSINIAIFASGSGSNALQIINRLPELTSAINYNAAPCVCLVVTDNPNAGVLNIAAENNIPSEIIAVKHKDEADLSLVYDSVIKKHSIDFIVLAGYLKKVPAPVTNEFAGRIINIHPALLPAYGGPGMYGKRVHEAVINAKEKQSGITIHYADDVYDHGRIIFQARCIIEENDTPETLAKKVLVLEHEHYPKVIADLIHSQNLR